MRSFVDLSQRLEAVPAHVVKNLTRIERLAGFEHRYHLTAPAVLNNLAQRARVESIRASSAIEDIVIETRALRRLTTGDAPRNRPEEEVAGYRDALDQILTDPPGVFLDLPRLLATHRALFAHTDTLGGRLKEVDNRVVDVNPDGTRVDRFKTVSAVEAPFYLSELHDRYGQAISDDRYHPILLVGLYVLDLLVIHPFDNGNGRTARLATTALLAGHGYQVVRYVAVEGLVDRTSNQYYASLKASTAGWHRSDHDVWPWLGYLSERIVEGYELLDTELSSAGSNKSKSQMVVDAIDGLGSDAFTKDDLHSRLPGVSIATITRVLQRLRAEGRVTTSGFGPGTTWRRTRY